MGHTRSCFSFSLLICAAFGCTSESTIKTHVVPGGPEARVAAVERIIRRSASLPGVIRQAELIEEQTGDGVLGPSDFQTFMRIDINAADAGQWKAALKPAQESKDFVSPRERVEWWLSEQEFRKLDLYEPKSLFGRTHGWAVFSADQKTIYVTTFTM